MSTVFDKYARRSAGRQAAGRADGFRFHRSALLSFRRFSALAGLMLVPYLAWVTFAAALTLGVWRLNPGTL